MGVPVLCSGGFPGRTVLFWGRQCGDVTVDIHRLRGSASGLLRALVHLHGDVVGNSGISGLEVVNAGVSGFEIVVMW